jgi:hypothetical protein
MTVLKRAELDMIGFNVSNDPAKQGVIALRWRKLTYVDGVLAATDYHRSEVDVDTDLDATLGAVADDIEGQGYTRPPSTDRAYIDASTNLAWTPEVRAAVAADRAAKRAAEEKRQTEQAARDAEAAAKREEERKQHQANVKAEQEAAAKANQALIDAAVAKALGKAA